MRIAERCDEPWDRMKERPGGRFCERCQHTVLDLSQMTRAQAEARVKHIRGGSVCVQLALGPDDEAIFRPEPSRAPHWTGGLVLVAALTAGGCGSSEPAVETSAVAQVESSAVDLGPPMIPTTLAPPAETSPPLVTGPVEPSALDDDHDAQPTPEQRALTARKQRAAIPAAHHHARGMMVLPIL